MYQKIWDLDITYEIQKELGVFVVLQQLLTAWCFKIYKSYLKRTVKVLNKYKSLKYHRIVLISNRS